MSKRSTQDKQIARLEKAMRPPTATNMDLVDYLVNYHRLTKKAAREALLAGKVKVDSHVVGRLEIEVFGEKRTVLDPIVPAEYRTRLMVTL